MCEVAMMERSMCILKDPWDVYLLECFVFALFSRSRWSDLKHLDSIWCDRHDTDQDFFGFIEARTKFHKTGSSVEKKLRFMPLVCPLAGETKTDWTQHWFEAMEEVGFDMSRRPLGAFCRAPTLAGHLGKCSLTSVEISCFLSALLNVDQSNKVSSHSLKHTSLSWCAKYGLHEDIRTLLGHHELPGKSYAVYSRDVLTRPLQQYCAMLMNMRNDFFQLGLFGCRGLVWSLEKPRQSRKRLPRLSEMQQKMRKCLWGSFR